MSISRRTALVAGPAIAAAGILAALPADAAALDAPLFAAIAHWREFRDAYMAERARQDAILHQVDAAMPDYDRIMRTYDTLLEATPHHLRTSEQHRDIKLAELRLEPHRKARLRRLKEAGYNEDKTDRMLDACTEACNEAFEIPAQTLAGLLAKMEMKVIEHPGYAFELDNGVDVIIADLRCLAGMA